MVNNMATYINVIKGKYKGLRGYLDDHGSINDVVLFDYNAEQILTTLKDDEYEIIEPKVV